MNSTRATPRTEKHPSSAEGVGFDLVVVSYLASVQQAGGRSENENKDRYAVVMTNRPENKSSRSATASTSDFTVDVCLKEPKRIESIPQRTYYTYNGTVEGHVKLKVTNPVSVRNIQVKLAGVSETRLSQNVEVLTSNLRREVEKLRHQLLYDLVTVFPPQNVASVSKNDKFTLIPGEYTYDFALKIPFLSHCGDEETKKHSNVYTSPYEAQDREKLECRRCETRHLEEPLPPCMDVNRIRETARITYQLKVSVHRPGMLTTTTRAIVPLMFRPPGPTLSLFRNSPFMEEVSPVRTLKARLQGEPVPLKRERFREMFSSTTKRQTVDTRLKLFYKPTLVPYQNNVQLMLQTSVNSDMKPPPVLYLKSIEVVLVQKLVIYTQTFIQMVEQDQRLLKSTETRLLSMPCATKMKEETGKFKSEIDLTESLKDISLDQFTPSFRTCNVMLSHKLRVVVNVSGIEDSWFSAGESMKIEVPVALSGELVTEDELTEMIGESYIDSPLYHIHSTEEEQLPEYEQ